MVSDLPTWLKTQHVHGSCLLGREIGESWVGDMICLKVELIERRQELSDGADAFVSYVDAVADGQTDETGMEAGPETLLRDLVTTVYFQWVEGL